MLKHALNISYYYSDFASIQVYTLAAKMDLKFDFFSKKKKKSKPQAIFQQGRVTSKYKFQSHQQSHEDSKWGFPPPCTQVISLTCASERSIKINKGASYPKLGLRGTH